MALEDALKAHAEALAAHAAALEANTKAVTRLTNVTLDARNGSAATQQADKAGGEKQADKPADKKPAEPPKPKGPSREDVVKALKDHASLEGKEAAIAILKDLGADSVSDLDPDKYQEAIDKANGK